MGGPIASQPRPIVFAVIVLAVAPALLACGPPAAGTGGTVIVVDDAGDSVSVRAPASRVVSLIPATTELLFAIGAGPAWWAAPQWCDYPPEARAVTNLGDGHQSQPRGRSRLRPDLVLLYNSAQHAAAAARLRELGIPALRINTDALGRCRPGGPAARPADRSLCPERTP